MVRKFIISLFLALAAILVLDTISIKNSVDMRNGPGSYYKLLLRLKPGAEVDQLDQQQQWIKVKAQEQTGWIPERSVHHQEQNKKSKPDDNLQSNAQNAFDELSGGDKADTTDNPYASRAQVAAAVKGFAKDFTSQKASSQDENLLQNFDGLVNASDYKQFREQRLHNWSWAKAQSRFSIDPNKAPKFNPLREKAGWGIANVIAQQGLIKNGDLQQYLTHIALIIAENSHRYETSVQVYILDSEDVTGYASPNGIIFVSKGALKLMENEAEFAFFVAHELAHIVFKHGVKESKKRETKIMADEAFEELNQEIDKERDEKYIKTEAELTEWANQVYEYTVKDRLNKYEHEADYWSVVYTYRAGYDVTEGLDLLQRIYNRQGDFKQGIGHVKWEGTSLSNRIDKIKDHLKNLNIPSGFGNSYRRTFQQEVGDL